LLGYVAARRGLPARPWLVNVVQRMRRARSIRAAILKWYGEDPLRALADSPERFWMVTTESHVSALVAEGVRADRVFFCPSTSDVQAGLFPDSAAALSAGSEAPLPVRLEAVRGQILLAGTNNRDVATAARAAELLGRPIHVLTDLSRVRGVASSQLVYHAVAPQAEFIAAVAHASVLVIPLVDNEESCGQQSLATAQRVGTLVVASDLPALRGYIVHGESGFLARPEDPPALAGALEMALSHADDASMLEAARERDRRDTVRMRAVFERAFAGTRGRTTA
jgi:glycosyltransferase involved in cell wall biosynthesis